MIIVYKQTQYEVAVTGYHRGLQTPTYIVAPWETDYAKEFIIAEIEDMQKDLAAIAAEQGLFA